MHLDEPAIREPPNVALCTGFYLQLQQLFVSSFLRSYMMSLPPFLLHHVDGWVRRDLYGAAMMIGLTLLG
jgi:hypothetical protein